MNFASNIRSHFQSLTLLEKQTFISNLTTQERIYFIKHPDIFLFDKQIIPDGNWLFYLLRCGRSFGKTFSGGAWVAKKVRSGARILGLCGATYDDVAKVMIPAIQSWFLPSELSNLTGYNNQTHTLSFTNGAKIYCYTSDKEIRGPNLEYLWCDEICVWADSIPEKIEERYEHITRTVRVGKHPQTIITSTPKSHPFFIKFQEQIDRNNPDYQMCVGTMFDNPYLPQSYIDHQLETYGNTPRGRQEIYADLITEDPAALFKMEWIIKNRITSPDNTSNNNALNLKYFFSNYHIKRIRICIDPAVSNGKTSDETGIIVLAQGFDNVVYVIHDKTGRHTPDEWARLTRDMYYHYAHHFPDTRIICEVNQGGDLVVSNICAADHTLQNKIITIRASKGKLLRAEPVAAKYQRDKVMHVGTFEKLERQMCNYTGDPKMQSPDAMDAMVHGVNALTIVPNTTIRDVSILEGY